ncbi:MAG: hypothetical protein WBL62_00790 [Gallionella sp.]
MKEFLLGSVVEHPHHGCGEVTFISDDYIGMRFSTGGDALLKRASFAALPILDLLPQEALNRSNLAWPDSTFIHDQEERKHYWGSRWNPFMEDANALFERLPELFGKATQQKGYAQFYSPSRAEPSSWRKGIAQVWPELEKGIVLLANVDETSEQIMFANTFPFFAGGAQTTLLIDKVEVWHNGVEAQISAQWGEGEVCFFDTKYLINRACYEQDKSYEFILTGLAYDAQASTVFSLPMPHNPTITAWQNQFSSVAIESRAKTPETMNLTGMAMFLPMEGWDKDDYQFRSPIKEVKEFTDFLGQNGWRVRATVMRFGDEDADLDIVITQRAWHSDAPPQVGQDIEGSLWLQGHLWLVNKK